MDTLPQAQAALRGQEIAWLADPIDMMLLHIQGSGRLLIQQNGQTTQTVRVAFAGTNNQPYRSINTWLQQQGAPITPWPEATKAWVRANPQRVNELLWSNPRYVFFREEALSDLDAQFGPRGAQGVALTPGRSIAVDPGSVPYGTPVWLSTQGPAGRFNKLVLAQDTGSAIVGAVRADYFTGWGDDALALAAGLKQPLQLWALWPR
jgi:membrane-bound lytic murein transglycosylase A